MAGVLQEAGDADSRARTRSQVSVEYFIIPYTSTFIRLSHLYLEFCVHCIVIMNDGGWDRWGWLIHIRVWVLSHSFFLFVLLSFGLSCTVSFFK